jgi:pimeloyl-ACP methyl ester carboxylesterase
VQHEVEALTRWLDAGGLRVWLREWGPADGPPVFSWHGLGDTGANHEGFGSLLAGEHGLRVLAPDLPGVGASPPLARERYDSDASADVAVSLLDALGIERCAFVGHSWGATIGCYAAVRHPRRLSALVLLDGGYLDLADVWPSAPPSYESLVELARGRAPDVTTPEVWAAVVEAGLRQPPSLVLERIPRELPVLLLVATEPAENERMRQERVTRFAAAVPHAAVRPVPGAGHNLPADAPEDVARIVGAWLAEQPE